MTGSDLVTAHVSISLEETKRILHEHRIEKLPLVDDDGRLRDDPSLSKIISDIRNREPPPLSQVGGPGSALVDEFIARTLAKDPS